MATKLDTFLRGSANSSTPSSKRSPPASKPVTASPRSSARTATPPAPPAPRRAAPAGSTPSRTASSTSLPPWEVPGEPTIAEIAKAVAAYERKPTAAGKETLRRLRAARTVWHGNEEIAVLSKLDRVTNYEVLPHLAYRFGKRKPSGKR